MAVDASPVLGRGWSRSSDVWVAVKMSRAFVTEPDGAEPFADAPEKLISEHPNYVTAEGLKLIEAEVAHLTAASAKAQATGDRAAVSAAAARDLRYWLARRATAELIPPPAGEGAVQFGSTVTVERDDSRRQTFRITGEDEADPAQGSISYVSPLARALMGKAIGDTARLGPGQVEVVSITVSKPAK